MPERANVEAIWQVLHHAIHSDKMGRNPASLPDAVYVIESPSPEDLLERRDEGEALARTLGLAEIEVHYFLAANEEMVEAAFERIATHVKERPDWAVAMPWIHFSAHGHEEGLELTDGQLLYWPVLTRMLKKLHKAIGPVALPEEYIQTMPKASLSLSSCGAFIQYRDSLAAELPVQSLVGSDRDIGWCQSLIAFSTFYYQALFQKTGAQRAVDIMNIAAGENGLASEPMFHLVQPFIAPLDYAEPEAP